MMWCLKTQNLMFRVQSYFLGGFLTQNNSNTIKLVQKSGGGRGSKSKKIQQDTAQKTEYIHVEHVCETD